MLPLLAGDIPWAAGGLMRCFEIITDEDTITNASFPAAVGKGPFGPAWGAGNLVAEVLAKMLDAEPDHRTDVQSICNGTTDLCVVSGVDTRGGGSKGFVSPIFDVMAGGYGAQVHHDGVDTGGRLIIPSARAPDVEMTEYLYPLVALWRREQTDSGGPGRQRGGMSGSVCYVQHPDQHGHDVVGRVRHRQGREPERRPGRRLSRQLPARPGRARSQRAPTRPGGHHPRPPGRAGRGDRGAAV